MKTIFCLVVFSLFMATSVSADDIVTKVNQVEITTLKAVVNIKHSCGEHCITISYITSVCYHKDLGRVSIAIHRGDTFHYDFGKDRNIQAKAAFKKLRANVFKRKFIKLIPDVWYR